MYNLQTESKFPPILPGHAHGKVVSPEEMIKKFKKRPNSSFHGHNQHEVKILNTFHSQIEQPPRPQRVLHEPKSVEVRH